MEKHVSVWEADYWAVEQVGEKGVGNIKVNGVESGVVG